MHENLEKPKIMKVLKRKYDEELLGVLLEFNPNELEILNESEQEATHQEDENDSDERSSHSSDYDGSMVDVETNADTEDVGSFDYDTSDFEEYVNEQEAFQNGYHPEQ